MAISSYGASTDSSGVVRILKDLDINIEGRDVLVVEDIIDSGLTLSYLMRNLKAREPASLEVCALLTKPGRREIDVPVRYIGFEIPNRFVIGYGLDFAERYRNLPYVAVLSDETDARGAVTNPKDGARAPELHSHAATLPIEALVNRFFRSALFPLLVIVLLVYLATQTLIPHSKNDEEGHALAVPTRSRSSRRRSRRPCSTRASSRSRSRRPTTRSTPSTTRATSRRPRSRTRCSRQARQVRLEGHAARRRGGRSSRSLLPFVLLFGFWIFLMNQVQGGGSKVMSFGKSRAKRMAPDSPKIGFKDVAGVDEAVEELQEIKEFLENPKKFQALGARIPKGVLLYGPPGTGKTLLARAVAGEAGVPFFSISGSDFVEMFVGVGASRVRDLFEQAKQARRASSSWTRSTPSAAIAAPGSAAVTTSASRR